MVLNRENCKLFFVVSLIYLLIVNFVTLNDLVLGSSWAKGNCWTHGHQRIFSKLIKKVYQ